MTAIRLVFGVHIHQPVGNFDHVFAQHVADVYRPFLAALSERDAFPIALHVSGPLLEWLETHDRPYLDQVGRLAADGKVELLLAGFYEPVLASLPRADRQEQLGWMRTWLSERFGVAARTAWLTERVWEPELAADLADGGVATVLVDDRHFLVTGFPRERLFTPYRTESDGRSVTLLPIDERLRYLVPFRAPDETASYLRALRDRGHALAVLADDGEKFGGWPGTREWVYERGWLREFLDMLDRVRAAGDVLLTTPDEAVRAVPSGGLAYLPTASYREMEEWSLWPDASARLRRLERDLGEERMAGPDGALVRGAHWRNFLAKYPESNRMHKKMTRLSALCRARGNPRAARRALGRAQCNDAYWHGVFGGLYLPHLREAVWRELARAESLLRAGESLAVEAADADGDGHDELLVHGERVALVVSPARGGGIEELTDLASGRNLADVLTRRWEAYHEVAVAGAPATAHEGAPSIHDLERGIRLDVLPARDTETRALFLDRVFAGDVDPTAFERGEGAPLVSWAAAPFEATVAAPGGHAEISLRPRDDRGLTSKTIRVWPDGRVAVTYQWRPEAFPSDAIFTTELSVAAVPAIVAEPAGDRWTYPISTVAKSERGLEATAQGTAIVLRWPVAAGGAAVTLPARPA